jgi:hypothetical protein
VWNATAVRGVTEPFGLAWQHMEACTAVISTDLDFSERGRLEQKSLEGVLGNVNELNPRESGFDTI